MGKKFIQSCAGAALAFYSMQPSNAMANPLKTVPWNGHVGAVSFTFDDALESQIQNLKPILDEMPDVQVTFFLTGMSAYFTSGNGPEGFASLAKAGHEIGNHSLSHSYLTNNSSDTAFLKKEVQDYADTIEGKLKSAGAEVNVTAFATPYCANDDATTEAIGKRHFMNRDCGDWNYRYSWDTEPDWFKFAALTWTRSGKQVSDITASLDSSANIGDFSGMLSWQNPPVAEGQWMPVLNHGVDENTGDEYSINPDDIKAIIQHARDNKMWIASFSTVGAYYKAHFTLDSAAAVASGDGYKVSWTMPHANMPKSIPLKVKISNEFLAETFGTDTTGTSSAAAQGIVLEQNGTALWPDNDGIFTVEFCDLALTIRKATAADSSSKPTTDTTSQAETGSIVPTAAPASHMAQLMADKRTTYKVFDLNGNELGSASGFKVPETLPHGIYIIRGSNPELPSVTLKIKH